MKTYIKPQSDIEKMSTDINILNDGSNPGLNGKGGDGNQLGNQGFMGDSDDDFPFNGRNLWDED